MKPHQQSFVVFAISAARTGMKFAAFAVLVRNVASVSVSSGEKTSSQDSSYGATTLGDIAAAFNTACQHEEGKKVCDKSIVELLNPLAERQAMYCNTYCPLHARVQPSFLQSDLEALDGAKNGASLLARGQSEQHLLQNDLETLGGAKFVCLFVCLYVYVFDC